MATLRSDFAAFVKGRVSASRVLTQELGTRPPARSPVLDLVRRAAHRFWPTRGRVRLNRQPPAMQIPCQLRRILHNSELPVTENGPWSRRKCPCSVLVWRTCTTLWLPPRTGVGAAGRATICSPSGKIPTR